MAVPFPGKPSQLCFLQFMFLFIVLIALIEFGISANNPGTWVLPIPGKASLFAFYIFCFFFVWMIALIEYGISSVTPIEQSETNAIVRCFNKEWVAKLSTAFT
jgi:hypothetical protein